MEKKEILSKLQGIFRDILDDENIVLENETTADDIEELIDCIAKKIA